MNKLFLVLLINTYALLSAAFNGPKPVAPQQAPREIVIETPGLLFTVPRFEVAPGELIKITLKNTDEMSHDMVITQPNRRENVIALALAMASDPGEPTFIPSTPFILQSIPLLKPGETKSITFTAPAKEGVYPYVCTYPGHGSIMYGAMYVSTIPMPPLETDLNIPAARRQSGNMTAMDHSMMNHNMNMPAKKQVTIFRTYMPNSGPAGIAVGMPGDISYNWDAGACRFRYAWTGGFVNLEKNWKGNGKDLAELEGTVFYTEKTEAPIRIGTKDHVPAHQFKGYTLVNTYPVFKYTLDDVTVTEKITPAIKAKGIVRTFTFSNLKKPLWFVKAEADKKPTAIGGKWAGNYLAVTPVAGKATLALTFLQ